MINGLHFDVEGDELAAHLRGRAAHHQERACWYKGRIDDLKAGGVEAMNMSGGDPIEALRRKHGEHARKFDIFTWMVEHLDIGEIYRLDEKDLAKLEIVTSEFAW